MRSFLQSVLFVLFVAFVSAGRADELENTIVRLMQERGIPGLSLAVFAEGKIVRAQGFGVITAGQPTPVTEATLFQAGSVSKPVAAFGALRLVEAGKLSLDTDVNTVLKSWHVPESPLTATEKVTLRRLLSHTAGLSVHGFPGYAVTEHLPTLVQALHGGKPANTLAVQSILVPGAEWKYSGGGYSVMQQLVVDITGRAFPALMSEQVLAPARMKTSTYEQPLPAHLVALTATAHLAGGKPVVGRWHVYPEMAAAGLWTTPSDLARFVFAFQDALSGKTGALLTADTARLMITPVKGTYGLGWSATGAGPAARFGHNGRDEGFDTRLVVCRETGQGAVVMININDDSNFSTQVIAAIGKTYGWPK